MPQGSHPVRALLADPRSLLARARGSDGYTTTDHLLMLVLDELRVHTWQRTKDGSKGRNRPKPVSPLAHRPGARTGRTTRRPAEVRALLARHAPQPDR
ncbi:DUF5361 domain-containing protein [Streptomyces sp. NPDC056690]|uniref:DUF5361 domain-containing protein n=1 Tax=Streptomyces sp. NPDC056690 TaxID=3345912 RepID=UPI003675BF6E